MFFVVLVILALPLLALWLAKRRAHNLSISFTEVDRTTADVVLTNEIAATYLDLPNTNNKDVKIAALQQYMWDAVAEFEQSMRFDGDIVKSCAKVMRAAHTLHIVAKIKDEQINKMDEII